MKIMLKRVSGFCLLCLALASGPVLAAADAGAPALLREKYATLEAQLQQTPFRRPLSLESLEESRQVKGDIYALLDHPFAAVSENLNSAADWCKVLILHLNTKYCSARGSAADTTLVIYIGKKNNDGLDAATRMQLRYTLVVRSADYLEIGMRSAQGPMGTGDYRIVVQAVALNGNKTFLHLSYAFSYSLAGKFVMKTYLATVGSGKVGFSRDGRDYIGGVRGLVERNTMRYYLAIDAYLAALGASPEERLERRLQGWFTAAEQFPRQLHEVERADYISMKRQEYERQQKPD